MSAVDLSPIPDHLARYQANPADVADELLVGIRDAILNHPRSMQVALGPSEIGHPCARRLGYKLLHQPENEGLPNWKATVGTALHAWLETVIDTLNLAYEDRTHSGQERFYVEQRVRVGTYNDTTVDGSCDLYDRVTGTVWDWKTTGPALLKGYRTKGPGDTYRIQAHSYGLGWVNRGMPVTAVGIIFLPRNGELGEAHVWHEPFDPTIAAAALQRLAGIDTAITTLGKAALPVLPTADAYCTHCPFFRATSDDLALGCPGHPGGDQHRSQDNVLDLI